MCDKHWTLVIFTGSFDGVSYTERIALTSGYTIDQATIFVPIDISNDTFPRNGSLRHDHLQLTVEYRLQNRTETETVTRYFRARPRRPLSLACFQLSVVDLMQVKTVSRLKRGHPMTYLTPS